MAPDDPKASGNEGEGPPPDENEASSSNAPSEAGQDGTGPETDSDVPPADAGGVDQSEIDALIRGLNESEPTAAREEAAPPAESTSESSSADAGGVDQSEIDALISGLNGSESTPAPEEAAPPAESTSESSSADAGDVGQDAVDALVSNLDGSGSSSVADEESASTEPTPEAILVDDPAEEEPGLLEQDELDALIAEFETLENAPRAQASATEKAVEVSAEEPEPEKSSEPPPETEAEEALAASGGTSDIDVLVAEASQQAEEKISADAPQEARDPEIEAALHDLEQQAMEEASVSEEETASVESLAQAETDSLQGDSETDSQSLSSHSDDTPIIDQPADEPLVDRDMDERLDSAADGEIGSDEPAVEAEAIESAVAVGDVEADAADEPADPASVLERVASENVAAGAVENAQEPATEPAAPKVEASATEDVPSPEEVPEAGEQEEAELVSTERAFSRRRGGGGARPSTIEQFRQSPTRVLASLAAGLLFALSAFVYFYANQLQSVSELALFPVGDAANLTRVLAHARELLDEGKSSEAVQLLDEALARAPKEAAGIDDGRYLRMEGVYQGLPETIPSSVSDDMHSQIDDLVETARSHPRAAEALYWKAKVYEREGNPIAARAEYRGILDNFGNAAILDQVMVSLSELLLAAERPIQAVRYLQRVIQEYPGSSLAARARLYLGDANAAAGDPENARIVYIKLAESQANTSIGALAFERIGKLALESGDYSGAIRELESRLETATTVEGNEHIYILLGKAYRLTGDLENARDILTELIDFFPESETTASALVELSQVMSAMDLEREAVRMATQAVERYPENIEVLRNAGELLGESGNAVAAARVLFAAHSAGANDPELLLAAGRQFRRAGIEDEAVAAFEELLTLFPTSSQALEGNIEWARVLYEQGRITDALERLEGLTLATEGQPRRIPVLRALAEMYRDLGLRQEVADMYAQIAGIAQEPELLAQAAIGLIGEGEADAGMRVVERIDRSKLPGDTAYALMMAQAEVWLRRDAAEALEIMEEAHASYAEHRTPEGVQQLLEASLTTGQTARARALVSDLQVRSAQTERAEELVWLERAAISWGDYLYGRKDYRTALEAYTIALGPLEQRASSSTVESAGAPPSAPQLWSMYQRANTLLSLARYQESLEYYDIVAASNSVWAEEAKTKAASARIEIRLRGDPVGETRNAG